MYSQSNTYCEGEWILETTTYNCSNFNEQVSCENTQGCSWQYSWGGWVSGGSNDCVGGQVTIDNSYCDGEMVTCEGEWVEEIISYDCSSFNSSATECNNHSGCWFEQNAYVGIYVFEDRCWGGIHMMNNSYCNGETVSLFLGCTDESALNYNPNANQDDGSCYFENNLDSCFAIQVDGCFAIEIWDPVCGCDGVTYSNSGEAACNSIYNFTSGECNNILDNSCYGISILLTQGWNMIGFSCSENTNALYAFSSIQDKIIIAKDGLGNAYLPDWDFNGIGDLERGYGYLIKVSEEISNYNICE